MYVCMYVSMYVCLKFSFEPHLFMPIESNHRPTGRELNDAINTPEDSTDYVQSETTRRKSLEGKQLAMYKLHNYILTYTYI